MGSSVSAVSRRNLLRGAAGFAGLAALAAAGCSSQPAAAPTQAPALPAAPTQAAAQPASQPAPQSTGAVTLQFLTPGTENGAWDAMYKAFKDKNPSYSLFQTPLSYPDIYVKLPTMVAGGTAPDIAAVQGWAFQPFADKSVLAPLDSYIKRDNFNAPWPDLELVKAHTVWNGSTYLIPLQIGVMCIIYAKGPFQEAGIPFPTSDWTFEDLITTAKKLTDPSKKKYGLQANGVWFRDMQWLRQDGQQEFDSLVNPKKAMFNQPTIIQNAQIMASDVYNTLKISPSAADVQGGAVAIENGNCAMKYEGPWYFPTMNDPKLQQSGKGVAFDAVLCPKGKDPARRHRAWSEGVMLPKTKQTDQAWEFSKYMASTEGQTIYVNIMGRVPNTLELVQSLWIPSIKKNFGVENGDAYIQAIKSSMPDVISLIARDQLWAEVVKPMGWDPLIIGSAKAADVMPKVDAGVQKLLDSIQKK
jgi:multiple sugar transport system substrate-binding protein